MPTEEGSNFRRNTPNREIRPIVQLGRVNKLDPLFDRSQFGEAKEAACGMVVSGGDASAVLEQIEEALDPVRGRIRGAVDRVLDMAFLLGGDLGRETPGANLVPYGVAVVAFVGQHDLRVGVVLGLRSVKGRAVVGFARRQ